jgi:uncharacterized membrane protein
VVKLKLRVLYIAGIFFIVWMSLIAGMLIIRLMIPLALPGSAHITLDVAKAIVVVLMVGLWLYIWKFVSDKYFGWAMKKRGVELG